jgi:hypothetical protein
MTKYFLEISWDSSFSWSQYTAPAVCSVEEIKKQLADTRKEYIANGHSKRKPRFRINLIEPERPLPELVFVDSWLEGLSQGYNSLLSWLNDNYVGRSVYFTNNTEDTITIDEVQLSSALIIEEDKIDVMVIMRGSGKVKGVQLHKLKELKFKNE